MQGYIAALTDLDALLVEIMNETILHIDILSLNLETIPTTQDLIIDSPPRGVKHCPMVVVGCTIHLEPSEGDANSIRQHVENVTLPLRNQPDSLSWQARDEQTIFWVSFELDVFFHNVAAAANIDGVSWLCHQGCIRDGLERHLHRAIVEIGTTNRPNVDPCRIVCAKRNHERQVEPMRFGVGVDRNADGVTTKLACIWLPRNFATAQIYAQSSWDITVKRKLRSCRWNCKSRRQLQHHHASAAGAE
mmetsp:Transcript_62232/g.157207  ORF Transcript_62232/g.157207 Transcript_62232/m.157207 type:complete len:247 (+) Transcript_62232:308-1048(+)